MKKVLELKGKTSEQKLQHVERILHHMRQRLGTKIIGAIPPTMIPIHIAEATETGKLMAYAVPLKGVISKAAISIGRYNTDKPVQFACGIQGRTIEASRRFRTKKLAGVVDIGVEVNPGDVVVFRIDEEPKEGVWPVEDIWLTLLFEVDHSHVPMKDYLLESLLAEEENDEGI